MRAAKKGFLLLAVGILMLLAVFPGYAAVQPQRKLRVGYIGYQGFMAPDDQGQMEGYGVEYLDEIGKIADFSYEYVYCTWAESLEMLKNHELDLVCTAKYTPERDQIYDFSSQNFGRVQGVLYVRPENKDIFYEDYQHLDGKRIGFLKGSLNLQLFANFAARMGFTYQTITFDSDEAMARAVKSGAVDAIATEQMSIHDDLRLVANYSINLYYLMSYEDNDFMDDIDYAMTVIAGNQYDYEAKLYEKYYGHTALSTTPSFTREERSFIQSCPTLRLAINTATEPMASIDKDGQFYGIDIDVLNRVSQISGLKFEYFPLPGRSSAYDYQYFRDHQIDLIGGVEVNEFNENIPSLVLTEAFFTSQKSMAVRQGEYVDTHSHLKVAVVGGSGTLSYVIAQYLPNAEILIFSNLEACLKAVVSGKADATLYNRYVLERSLNRPQYDNLRIVPNIFLDEKLCLSPVDYSKTDLKKQAVTGNPLLLSVLNKAIESLSDEDVTHIVIANTIAQQQSLSWGDFIYKFRFPIFLVGALLLVCIAHFSIILINRQRNLIKIKAANRQLADAVGQAQRASVAKSLFLSRMSHEIRTPMNAIVGISQIAKKYESEPQVIDDYLNKIDASSKVLLNIINDVLDMSAIENDKMKIADVPFDLKNVLNGISGIYYTQCAQKGVDFSILASLKHEKLSGDSLRLHQILMNLISNAYKFTETGGAIRLTVDELQQKQEQVFIRFAVSDTGCGMNEEFMARMFKPFEQENAETANKYGGSGLGLAIAKNLVELMRGAITVQSAPGKGTTFTVDLPFTCSEPFVSPCPNKLKAIRALVVDDQNTAIEYTGLILERIGVSYEIATNAQQALEKIEKADKDGKSYDICFIDWKMPGLNGLELTRQIRRRCYSMMLIVSAYDLSLVEKEARNAGADWVVSKPLFQSTVFNAIMQLIGGRFAKETEPSKSYDFTGFRALLAEDNQLNAEIASELLQMAHMEIDIAQNGQIAISKFEDSQPETYDLILMDVQMPVMDGYEATRKIRASKHPQARSIPILAMTANAFTEDISAALSAGMNGHISKPIDTEILYQTIERAIKP